MESEQAPTKLLVWNVQCHNCQKPIVALTSNLRFVSPDEEAILSELSQPEGLRQSHQLKCTNCGRVSRYLVRELTPKYIFREEEPLESIMGLGWPSESET